MNDYGMLLQKAYVVHPLRCLMGTAPSIANAQRIYGIAQLRMWIVAIINDIAQFAGVGDKLSIDQAQETADIIMTEHRNLRLTELHLFAWKMKSGCYGEFFGNVDPMHILAALRTYCRTTREQVREQWYQEQARRREQERDQYLDDIRRGRCMSRQLYDLIQSGAFAGDFDV